jgi:hypothetical protein
MAEDFEIITNENVEWYKLHNDECLVLLQTLAINNKIDKSESYDEKTGDAVMVKLISNNKKLTVMYAGSLNNRKANSTFMTHSAIKTLDYLSLTSNLVNNNRMQGDIFEYMEYRGWISKKKAYRQVKQDLEFLSRIQMEYTGKHSFKAILLSGGEYGINSGKIFFLLSQPFANVYKGMITQYINPKVFKIDANKYPAAYLIAKKLFEVYSMNYNKSNAGFISVENLIKSNPHIPKYNSKIGKVHRNIINPTIRCLKAISDDEIFFFNNINQLCEQKSISRFLAFKLKYTPINYPVLKGSNVKRIPGVDEKDTRSGYLKISSAR